MTRNPYAHPIDPEPEPEGMDRPRRVSGLAVASLVFGILCCLPGVGLVGTILGGAALIGIVRSEGRLGGRALAFIGLVLGILGTVLWLAIGLGGRQMLATADRRIFAPTIATFQAAEKQDWGAAGKLFSPGAGITEDDLKAFAAGVQGQVGAVSPGQHLELLKFFTAQDVNVQTPGTPVPLPVEFQNGRAVVLVVLDSPDALGEVIARAAPLDGKVIDIGVFFNGKETWLADRSKKKGAGGAR